MAEPKLYLISSRLTPEQVERAKSILDFTPIQGVIAMKPEDVIKAQEFCPAVIGLQQPMAILADFPGDLAVINDDGSVEVLDCSSSTIVMS